MEEDFFGAAKGANFGDGLDHANLIVYGHDTHDGSVRADGSFQVLDIYQSILLDWKI